MILTPMKTRTRIANWKLPREISTIRVGTPKLFAGGFYAIISALSFVFRSMGVIRGTIALLKMNQKGGFDCPGCAWPDPDDDRSHFEFCENGAKALAEEATRRVIGKAFFEKHSIEFLASQSDYWLSQQGRIGEPLYLDSTGHYSPITWENAFTLMAKKLRSLSSPKEAVFYTSGRTSNEAAYLYQLFARVYGTNNLPDCSNLCHESSGVAMKEAIGIGKGTVTLDDFKFADLIFIVGQNPGTNHPRMLTTLQTAKNKGARIITISPLDEAGTKRFKNPQNPLDLEGSGTQLSDLHIPVKINGDMAFFQLIGRSLLESDYGDQIFIDEYTSGYDEYVDHLYTQNNSELYEICGLDERHVITVAEMIRESKSIIMCWAMGLTQHKNAVATIQEALNLLLLGGNIGRKGAGPCPVRGHSNVQGDRTMGIWECPDNAFLEPFEREFDIKIPRESGHDVVHAIEAMDSGNVKFFMAMGGNFLSASPDTEVVSTALNKCDLTVHVSTKLNRTHLCPGTESLILPPLSRSEIDVQPSGPQKVSVENSMGIVHSSQGHLAPCSPNLLSEVKIISQLAIYTFLNENSSTNKIPWNLFSNDYSCIRNSIEKTIPGFDRYNERLENSFSLPNPPRDSRIFDTPNKKANFSVNQVCPVKVKDDEFILMTFRSHDQYNTTIYGLNDRYRGVFGGRRIILMNPLDMKRSRLEKAELVQVSSNYDNKIRSLSGFKVYPYDIPLGCIGSYFPETNPLVPLKEMAVKSHTPISKSIVVQVRKEALQ